MPAAFKDLFSGTGAAYARFRPRYPQALFDWLAAVSPGHELAVDVGTGNGQAAVALAADFDRVIGIEPGAGQLKNARPHDRVEYRQAAAEDLGLPAGGVDLLLAAQAFHWFAAARFFAEAARVLRPQGVLALVTYGNCVVEAGVDAVIDRLYRGILGPYWEPERRLVEIGYAHVVQPFGAEAPPELVPPTLQLGHALTCDELIGYLGTWSALVRFHAETGRDGVAEIEADLRAAWARATARAGDARAGDARAGVARAGDARAGDAQAGDDRLAVVWPLTVRAWPRP
jgi:SAM-dependent methyltransferase